MMPRFARNSKMSGADKKDQSLVAEAESDRMHYEAEAAGESMDASVAMFGEEREAWEKEQAAAQALVLKAQKQQAKRMEKLIPGDYQVSLFSHLTFSTTLPSFSFSQCFSHFRMFMCVCVFSFQCEL